MKEQSYIVVERFVDLNGVMRGVRHAYSESDTLIKYSKKEHSPVSSVPSDLIRLGTHNSFADYIKKPGLVGDDSEGKVIEIHDWTKRGSRWVKARRKLKCYRLFRPKFSKVKTSFFAQIRQVSNTPTPSEDVCDYTPV